MTAPPLDELRHMQATASRSWGPSRRWTAGELAWAFLTDPAEQEVHLFPDGWAWKQEDFAAILTAKPETIAKALEWAGDAPVQVPDGDDRLYEAVRSRGYMELQDAPFDLDMRLSTDDVPKPVLPDRYVVRSAEDGDNLLEVHRAAWRPADLPFASEHAPPTDPTATSSLTIDMLTLVESARPYRPELHVVVEAPDGSLAASCIAWLDLTTSTAAIEPLGVRREHRRRGLAGALCLHAAQLVKEAGGHEIVIHPRGDPAYPAPQGAYLRSGFIAVGRTRIYARR